MKPRTTWSEIPLQNFVGGMLEVNVIFAEAEGSEHYRAQILGAVLQDDLPVFTVGQVYEFQCCMEVVWKMADNLSADYVTRIASMDDARGKKSNCVAVGPHVCRNGSVTFALAFAADCVLYPADMAVPIEPNFSDRAA